MIPVTVVIPVHNEEVSLPSCLPKLQSFKEIVVVNSSSTDRTVDIAVAEGAKVIQFRWNGQYPKKRNWVLQNYQFQTAWVLFLDADEEVTPAFEAELAASIENTKYTGFWIHYQNFFLGKGLRYGVPQRKLALFKVGKGAYERIDEDQWSKLDMEIHEHPIIDGPVGEVRSPIIHYDFKTLHGLIERHNEYSSWEARRYIALRKSTWKSLTSRQRLKYSLIASGLFPFAYFLFAYVIRAGFLDGRAGFQYALFKCVYFHQIGAKIREAQSGTRVTSRHA